MKKGVYVFYFVIALIGLITVYAFSDKKNTSEVQCVLVVAAKGESGRNTSIIEVFYDDSKRETGENITGYRFSTFFSEQNKTAPFETLLAKTLKFLYLKGYILSGESRFIENGIDKSVYILIKQN